MVMQKWLEKKKAENLKNIGNLRNDEAPSYCNKYNIRQKLVFLKLVYTSPEEHFATKNIFWKKFNEFFLPMSEQFSKFGRKFSAGWSKLYSTCPEEHVKEDCIF